MAAQPLRLAVALNGYGVERYEQDGFVRDILPWSDLQTLAVLSEELGFERIFVPQIAGREAFSTLAGFGAAAGHIGLATGVVRLSDDLSTIGMAASSVDEMTGGRLVLGVGSGYSIDRTGQLATALRDVLRGEEGIVTDPDDTWPTGQLDWQATPRRVPIYLAALGPRMVALSGEVADGVILNWCTPERVAEAKASIGNRDGFTISVYVRACIGQPEDQSISALKTAAARYAGMDPYARQFRAMGLGKAAREVSEGLRKEGHPRDVVPDELVTSVCLWGSREEVWKGLERYREAGADLVVVYPVAAGEAVSSLTGTLMAAAPGA